MNNIEKEIYDNSIKAKKTAYSEILKVCKKHEKIYDEQQRNFSDINTMKFSALNVLLLIDWYEKYGLIISHEYKPLQLNYFRISDNICFSYFIDGEHEKAKGTGKYITWSDDGRQPKNEWLLNISFSTGAYIFGDDYNNQQNIFQDFINELKTYDPDYSDTINKSFYWKLENAKKIYEEYSTVFKKYYELNRLELNKRKADKLRKELEKLETAEMSIKESED